MKNGIIPVSKPEGISSAAVVSRVKKVLKAKKVGHTGTLDPFASGLLLCAINQGTRISSFFLGGKKQYQARLHLGQETDTYDLTGNVEKIAPASVMRGLSEDFVNKIVLSFKGPQEQIPPSFSALKHKGQPLYKLARQGKKIIKPPRQIDIYDIKVLMVALPFVDIDVSCSAGTYIRTLAFDIGRKLGCGAHLSKLCRTGSSQFHLAHAVDLEALEQMDPAEAQKQIIPLSECLSFLPSITVDHHTEKKISYGQPLSYEDLGDGLPDDGTQICLLDHQNEMLAIIKTDHERRIINYSCVFCA